MAAIGAAETLLVLIAFAPTRKRFRLAHWSSAAIAASAIVVRFPVSHESFKQLRLATGPRWHELEERSYE